MKRIELLILIAAVLIIGCKKESAVEPSGYIPGEIEIELRGLQDSIRAFEGALITISFSVIARDMYSNGIPELPLHLGVVNWVGSINPISEITDKYGIMEAELSLTISSGKSTATIFAEHGQYRTEKTIQILGTPRPASLEMNMEEDLDWTDDFLYFTTTVLDENGDGLSNIRLNYTLLPFIDNGSTFGSIPALLYTDSLGMATAEFNSAGSQGTQIIKCEVADDESGNPLEYNIIFNFQADDYHYTLGAGEFIYADGAGGSMTSVVLIATDRSGVGVDIDPEDVTFTTDSEYAVMDGWKFDYLGNPDTDLDVNLPTEVMVTARFEKGNFTDSVSIEIRRYTPVIAIQLSANDREISSCPKDSTLIMATCLNLRGYPAAEGVRIKFHTDNGSFSDEFGYIEGEEGIATTYYIAGEDIGTVGISSTYREIAFTIFSDTLDVDILPGEPASGILTIYPAELDLSLPDPFLEITLTVTDNCGQPVRIGTEVTFEVSLGTITPSALTNEIGEAVAILLSGREAGICMLVVHCQDITLIHNLTFIAGTPESISLNAEPSSIPAEYGQSTIRAMVRDAGGYLIETPTTVVFEIVDEPALPEGCTFGNGSQTFMSRTSNGVAVATLHAGALVGLKTLRAYTWRDSLADPGDIIEIISQLIEVTENRFATRIEIDVNDEGWDAGGGAWVIEVSARVWDVWSNPVEDGTIVEFMIGDWNIEALTGNENHEGRSFPGIAFIDFIYNSQQTGEDLRIEAKVQTPNGEISAERDHIYPLQEGVLELNVDPAVWHFEEGRERSEIRCWVVLNDGHSIEINNMPILFTSNRGNFGWYDVDNQLHMFGEDPVRKLTGPQQEYDEEPGQATVFLIAEEDDIFLDPFTREVTVQINAWVDGNDEVSAEPQFITFTR